MGFDLLSICAMEVDSARRLYFSMAIVPCGIIVSYGCAYCCVSIFRSPYFSAMLVGRFSFFPRAHLWRFLEVCFFFLSLWVLFCTPLLFCWRAVSRPPRHCLFSFLAFGVSWPFSGGGSIGYIALCIFRRLPCFRLSVVLIDDVLFFLFPFVW